MALLTGDEQRVVLFVLTVLVIGSSVKHCRRIPETEARSQNQGAESAAVSPSP